jgi:hypothetical protein
MVISIPVSWGELVDKITILEIKMDRIPDAEKRANIKKELQSLRLLFTENCSEPEKIMEFKEKLLAVNEKLWVIEDKDFSQRFIELARAVYINNDKRAELKREINTVLKSELFEEKSYEDYT